MSSYEWDISGREPAVELVIGAMTETLNFKVAAVALRWLPPDEEAAATVVTAYQQDRVVPWLAALLIGAIRHERGYRTALAILRRGAGLGAESYAGSAMAKIRGVGAFDDLAAVLREPGLERRVYEGAAYGLRRVADPRALALVIDACMQKRIKVDTAGSIAADCASEAALLRYLASPEPRYQSLALHAFFYWSASGLAPPSRAAREAVLHALARPEAVPFPGPQRAMLEQRFGHGVSSRRSALRSPGPLWDLPSPSELYALVDDKLREGAWDLRPRLGGGHPIPDEGHEPESFDEYREQVIRRVEQRHDRRLEELRNPPHRHLIRIASRQYGFGDALDGKPVERKLADDVFLALQSHRARYITAETWRREIAALDRADAWLALAAQHEAAGRLVQSNAALATARWFDPATAASATEIVRDRRTESLPDRLLEQPQPGFRARRLGDRHWRAWSMKHDAVDLPSLIAYACDENFSVRARIYRSLGQQSLVAAVPVLREALHDPDDFARAQAVRSLGWIGEPTSFEPLLRLAGDDRSAEVCRSAMLACQRIAGYWRFYGEWRTIIRSPRLFEVARELASAGLGGFANDLVEWQLCRAMSSDDYDAIRAELQPFSLAGDRTELARRYDYHFAAASELEGAIARADPEHEPDLMLALHAASKQHVMPARIADLVTAPEPLGWNARRALRALRLTE